MKRKRERRQCPLERREGRFDSGISKDGQDEGVEWQMGHWKDLPFSSLAVACKVDSLNQG